MNDFDNVNMNENEYEEENPAITLLDENGNEVHFEILDFFEFEGKHYTVLLPYEEESDDVVILEVIHGENEDEFNSVDDEDLLYRIFDEFKERNKDEFNFED